MRTSIALLLIALCFARRTAATIPASHPAHAPSSPDTLTPHPGFTREVAVEVDSNRVRAIVHVPRGFDVNRPAHIVVFFHGSGVCIGQMLGDPSGCGASLQYGPGCGDPSRFDSVRGNAILVVPQLRFGGRDPFSRRGTLAALLRAVVDDVLPRDAGLTLPFASWDGITLVAHSAGHTALVRGLEDTALAPRVRHVVLLDVTPIDPAIHRRWLALDVAHHRLALVHTGWSAARRFADSLAAALRTVPGTDVARVAHGAIANALTSHTAALAFAPFEHGWLPWLYFPKLLASLALPSIDVHPRGDEETHTSTSPSATPWGGTNALRGDLSQSDPRSVDGSAIDTYRLELTASHPVRIDVAGQRSRTDPAIPLDVFIAIYDGDERLVADDDSLGRLGSRIVFTPPRDGTYTLRITSYGPGLREGAYVATMSTP